MDNRDAKNAAVTAANFRNIYGATDLYKTRGMSLETVTPILLQQIDAWDKQGLTVGMTPYHSCLNQAKHEELEKVKIVLSDTDTWNHLVNGPEASRLPPRIESCLRARGALVKN